MPYSYVYTTGGDLPYLVAGTPSSILEKVRRAVDDGLPREFLTLPGVAYSHEYNHDTDVAPYYAVSADYVRADSIIGVVACGFGTLALIERAKQEATSDV